MKIVAIIQARMGSTRLPGKSMLPLAGKPMIQQIIERVRRSQTLDFVVLAYPLKDSESFRPMLLNNFVGTSGVPLGSYAYPGDENDLVSRYALAALAYEADIIVRIPGDNPCVDPEYIDQAVMSYLNQAHIFYTNTTALSKDYRLVDGIGAEVFSMSRLKWLDRITDGAIREHPHQWFWDNGLISLPRADIRLDVNTQEDYDFIADIYNHVPQQFTTEDVLTYLATKEKANV